MSNLQEAIICDLDGTLCLFDEANPYDRNFMMDRLNKPVANIVSVMSDAGYEIILVSGRKDIYRIETEAWLARKDIPWSKLYMRPAIETGAQEPKDVLVKQKIYEENIKDRYNIKFVLDDRNQVVDFWRSQGLTCLQVAPGDF